MCKSLFGQLGSVDLNYFRIRLRIHSGKHQQDVNNRADQLQNMLKTRKKCVCFKTINPIS